MAEDCCTSSEVTGGTYYRTYTSSGTVVSGVGDPATVSGFRLDKYLVTVGRFRELVAAWNGGAGYLPSMGFGKHAHLNGGKGLLNSGDVGTYEAGWDATAWNGPPDLDPTDANLTSCPDSTWTSVAAGQENLPINCVNWWEAYAFCIWDGGFLPSEAEWEYAAAGGSLQREYPWGATTPGTACPGAGCEYAIYNCDYPSGTGSCTGVANIAPVGTATLGAGLWGQLDMAGDVVEWNLDWYEASYGNPCADCSYLAPETERAFRGGHFGVGVAGLSPPDRAGSAPTGRDSTWGFRCARTP
jgi:formylglycine-generating enzyme required for sulfatase activity